MIVEVVDLFGRHIKMSWHQEKVMSRLQVKTHARRENTAKRSLTTDRIERIRAGEKITRIGDSQFKFRIKLPYHAMKIVRRNKMKSRMGIV